MIFLTKLDLLDCVLTGLQAEQRNLDNLKSELAMKKDLVDIAERLECYLDIAKIEGDPTIYVKLNAIYEPLNRDSFRELIFDLKKSVHRENQINELCDCLWLMAKKKEPLGSQWIAFANGIYNVADGSFDDLRDDYIITHKIPYCYNKEAYNQLLDDSINQWMLDDPDCRSLLEEAVGYCLMESTDFQAAFFLSGTPDGSNGKSIFLSILQKAIGVENCAYVSFDKMGENFIDITMKDKLVNVAGEINTKITPENVRVFKSVVTGDVITSSYKHKDFVSFAPYCTCIFNLNSAPNFQGHPDLGAIIRRSIFIPFLKSFKDQEIDVYLEKKLSNSSSYEYLLKLGVEGIQRLQEKKAFTQPEASRKALSQVLEHNQAAESVKESLLQKKNDTSVFDWIESVKERYPDPKIYLDGKTVSNAYENYSYYCTTKNIEPIQKNQLTIQLKKIYPEVETKNIQNNKCYDFQSLKQWILDRN